MSRDKSKWRAATVNRRLLDILDRWTEQNAKNGLPFPTSPDVLNKLILNFLIEVTQDKELLQLAERLEPIDKNVHSAIERFFKTRPKRD